MMIACTNSKGGVGKSTLAVHLAICLFDKGFSVGVLDTDKQRSSSEWVREAEPGIRTATADSPDECLAKVQELKNACEIVIADGPAGLDDISRTLLLLADVAVFPITPSILDVRSVAKATEILRFAQTINGGRPAGRLVLNKMRPRETTSRELILTAPHLGVQVTQTILRDLQVFRDAAQQGTVVTRMGSRAGVVRDEIEHLGTELLRVCGKSRERKISSMNKEVANG
jgi:chromosome partitioning protein